MNILKGQQLISCQKELKKGKLVITRTYNNPLWIKGDTIDGEAWIIGIFILSLIYALNLLLITDIPSVIWANIAYFVISAITIIGSINHVEDHSYIVQKCAAICVNVCFMLLGLMACWQIQTAHPKDYLTFNVPYLSFLFKFHF